MNRTRNYYSQLAIGLVMGLSSFGIARVEAKKPVVVPQISGVAPALVVSTTPQTFTVAGSNFQSGLTVSVGVARSITNKSFQWTVTPSTPGTLVVQVTNPDGGTSSPYSTTVTAPPSPIISCPTAQSVTSSTGLAVNVSYPQPTVSGGAAPVTTTCSPASGSAFGLGTTSVACAATDALQRSASCSFAVSVVAAPVPPPPPPAPPTIQCPVNQTAASTDGASVAVSFPAPIVSGGAAPVTSTCSPASGSLFPVGSTNVTCTATDSLSQTNACQFSTLVLGPTAPPASTPSGDPTTWPLVQQSNLVYQGAFRLPGGSDDSNFVFGGQALAYNPANNSLFVEAAAINPQVVGEVTIPATLVNSATLSSLTVATVLQTPTDPTEGHLTGSQTGGSVPAGLAGLLVNNGQLYGAAGIYYDANNELSSSHYSRSTNLGVKSFDGFHALWNSTQQGFVSGYLAAIPSAWQTLLHGDIFSGNFGQPIVTRESWGPDAIAWSSADFDSTTTIPATPLVYYTGTNDTLGSWNGQNVNFGMTSAGTGAAFPVGTRSLLVVGLTGLGPACYGEGTSNQALAGQPVGDGAIYCYDPTDSAKGTHAYPYRWNVWAYDANDLQGVVNGSKTPWTPTPYANFGLTFPSGTPGMNNGLPNIGGVAYDPATNRLFVAQLGVDPGPYGYAARPLIHVFKIQ
ncbi:MAG TPA: HYR domain-containing protein [Vicinamibacterales bacterium]|nr:HYR domain-containing protein [Vicinamibacterales bacterium]